MVNVKEIRDKLKSKGIKPTYQRIKIYKYLLEHRTHPDVEKIYKALYPEIPSLSKTTVYNTLKELSEKNLIIEIPFETKLCFDGYTEPHSHFICEKCNKIYDVNIDLNIQKFQEINGHIIKKLCCIVIGICVNCQRNKKE